MGLGICAALFVWTLAGPAAARPERFVWAAGAYLAVCVAAAVSLTVWVRPRPEIAWAVPALLFGVGFLFLITPLSPPDEEYHYRACLVLSNFLLGRGREPLLVPAGYLDFTGFTGHWNTLSGWERVLADFAAPLAPEGDALAWGEVPGGYLLTYLPQTLFLTLARGLRLGFVPAFLLGRLGNLLFFTGCTYHAVRLSPRYKTALGVTALLPMTLQQAASWSYDAAINGLALLYTAALFRCLLEKGPLPRGDFWRLLLLGALLAPAKGAYAPLLLLAALLPAGRFSSQGKKWGAALSVILTGVLLAALFQLSAAEKVRDTVLNWEGKPNYTLAFALQHPGETARIFARTLRFRLWLWVRTALGSHLSGLTLPLRRSTVWALAAVTLLSGGGLGEREARLRLSWRLGFLAAAGLVVLAFMGAMFLWWTSEGRPVIEGVQGRYFLPVAPLTVAALGVPFRRKRETERLFPPAMAALNAAALAEVILYTLRN